MAYVRFKMINYAYINVCFLWIYMFYTELVKKLLLVSFILGFESLWSSNAFLLCAVRSSSYVQFEPVDRMVDWYQEQGSVDRAICDKPTQGVIRRSGL